MAASSEQISAEEIQEIKGAVYNRKDYIIENLSTLTMKQFRGMLENDLGRPPKSLKEDKRKALIDKTVDKIVVKYTTATQNKPEAEEIEAGVLQPQSNQRPAKQSPAKKNKEGGRKSESKENSGQKKNKRDNPDDVSRKRKKVSQYQEAQAAPKQGGKQYDGKILKMKDVCKKAGLTIPTAIYKKKNDADIADEIEALLERHGLSRSSGRAEIAEAKAKIQKEKELEGIDTSNILEGGRRSRSKVSYVQAYKGPALDLSGSEDEEDEEEDNDDDDDSGSDDVLDEIDEPSSKKKRKLNNKAKLEVEDQEEEEPTEAGDPVAEGSGDDDSPKDSSEVSEAPESNEHPNGKLGSPGREAVGKADGAVAGVKHKKKVVDWSDDD